MELIDYTQQLKTIKYDIDHEPIAFLILITCDMHIFCDNLFTIIQVKSKSISCCPRMSNGTSIRILDEKGGRDFQWVWGG